MNKEDFLPIERTPQEEITSFIKRPSKWARFKGNRIFCEKLEPSQNNDEETRRISNTCDGFCPGSTSNVDINDRPEKKRKRNH